MSTATVILTPKKKKGKSVSYPAILEAVRTVNKLFETTATIYKHPTSRTKAAKPRRSAFHSPVLKRTKVK